jgi:hypothetical protein
MIVRPSDRWPEGARVSIAIGDTVKTGTVVILRRKVDNAPFRMIQMDGHGDDRIGQRVWPDGWVLGIGKYERRCLEDQQRFRTNDTGADFCPLCDQRFEQEVAAASRTRNISATLNGAKGYGLDTTKAAPRTDDERKAIADLRAQDEKESLF